MDPFAAELVLVPARGVERWLSQRLSHLLGHGEGREDGVCAGVAFRSPASLVAELVIGGAGTREHDPWSPDALVWPLLGVVDAHAGAAALAPPASPDDQSACQARQASDARTADVAQRVSGDVGLAGCVADATGIAHVLLSWRSTDSGRHGRICTDPTVSASGAWRCRWSTTDLPRGPYVVRFVACVALHAVWSTAAGITLFRRQNLLHDSSHWFQTLLTLVALLIVPMVLHGLYDTLLKKDLELWALAVGAASFAWFALQVELARATDPEKEDARGTAWS